MMAKTLLLTLLLIPFISSASTDEQILAPELSSPLSFKAKISPEEEFARSQAVLKYYKINEEAPVGDYYRDIQQAPWSEVKKKLPFLDPFNIWPHFSTVKSSEILIYQDFNAKKVLDFKVSAQNLRKKSKHLNGLRIALDPGHMGGSFWDIETGKFVQDSRGRKVSEGLINLQVCLLLKKELEDLGAQVLITRSSLKPTSSVDYKKFPILPYSREELRLSTLTSWYRKILESAPIGSALYKNFDNDTNVKKLFSESSRANFFIKRADLDARVDMITAFDPQMTIIVHFDAAGGVNPSSPNATRAYVPGGFQASEFSSRNSRKYFVRHLLDENSWQLSLELTRHLLGSIEKNMGIPKADYDGTESVKVEQGIFARNLHVSRKLKGMATSYLEVFYYNRPQEFEALLDARHPMQIDGQTYMYSDRLKQVSDSLRDGVVSFVNSLQ